MTGQGRRDFLRLGGLAIVSFGLSPLRPLAEAVPGAVRPRPAPAVEVIEMQSDLLGTKVWFDPIGLHVAPGTTVRWVVRANVHTTTSYSPQNAHHPLRIPDGAAPWDSGYLVHPGDHFDVTLTVPGVYDYFCMPHEGAGMVGRIVVGDPHGSGVRPFDYWVGRPGTGEWTHVPSAAQKAFPTVAEIMAERRVRPVGSRR